MNRKQRRVVVVTLFVLALGSLYYGVETRTTSSASAFARRNPQAIPRSRATRAMLTFVFPVLLAGLGRFLWFGKD